MTPAARRLARRLASAAFLVPAIAAGAETPGVPAPGGPAFMLNLSAGGPNPQTLQTFTLPDASSPSVVGPQTRPLYALDFDDSTGTLWAVDNATRELGRLGTADAVFTPVVLVTGIPAPETISGLGISPRDGTFFVSTTTGAAAARLYRLNPSTGAATAVGDVTGHEWVVDVTVDCDGVIYALDTGMDQLLTLDPLTAVPTTVGSTGIDAADVPQGLDVDGATGNLYAWLELAAGGARLVTLDRRTGTATLVSTPPDGQYVGAIPGCCAGAKGDFNLDASVDVVFRNTSSNRMAAWFMDGAVRVGGAVVSPDPASPDWRVVATDDFDDETNPGQGPDGYKSDLLLRNFATGALEFWLMDGVTRVGPPVPLTGSVPPGLEWELEASGDFDGDENPDLVWRNSLTGDIVVWKLAGTTVVGTVTPTPSQAPHLNWRIVAALDFSHDGFRDLLWYNSTSGKAVLWILDGGLVRQAGYFTTPASASDANWEIVAGGDFGAATVGGAALCANDLLWRNRDSGKLVVWRLDFAGQRQQGLFTTPDAPQLDARRWIPIGPR